MAEWTIEQMRAEYLYGFDPDSVVCRRRAERFDACLAAHDAEAKAEALREAAYDLTHHGLVSFALLPSGPSRTQVHAWLRARAAAIRGEQ